MRASSTTVHWSGITFLFIFLSFFVVYLQQSLLANVLVLMTAGAIMVFYFQTRKFDHFPKTEFGILGTALSLTALSLLLNESYSFRAYLFLFCSTGLYFIFDKTEPPREQLLKIHNATFLIYVFLSSLLYFELINIDRPINTFPTSLFGYSFRTFFGFHGSTASIDSYSAFTLVVNLLLNKRFSKWFFVLLSGFIAAGTLRSTPVLVIFGSFLSVFVIRILGTKMITVLNLVLFLSFTTPFLVMELLRDDTELLLSLKMATTGRSNLWITMLDEYLNQGLENQLFGFSNANSLSVDVWKENITNPHNAFFSLLISYGLLVLVAVYLWLTKKMRMMGTAELIITYAVLMGAISNGELFNFSGAPLVVWILYCTATVNE